MGISDEEDLEIENSVLGFLVAHRALSRGGIGFVARRIDGEAFGLLGAIENMVTHASARPRVVWRLLQRIGEIMGKCFEDEEMAALSHASSLTSFSEFPIGVAILPGGSSPLCCRIPIAYRPIVPLTRSLQFESMGVPTIHLKGQLSILVAECISADDPVGRLSRVGWRVATRTLTETHGIKCRVIEVGGLNDLKNALQEHDYDILVISAHGGMIGNRTGFMCGGQLVVEDELGRVPKIVCLSACQVSPRGSGTVNITDLLFRQGAVVVLGTIVPIDVSRNAVLMARFFANVSEAILGRLEQKTFEEVWHFTSMSNAFTDVLTGNMTLFRWAGEKKNGKTVIEEFMHERSVGRLRRSHIYEDTETILAEIAQDRGIGDKFRSWLASQGYFPESVFYVVMGWPDRIVFYDPAFQQVESDLLGSDPPPIQSHGGDKGPAFGM